MNTPAPPDLQMEQAQLWLCEVLQGMGIPAVVEIVEDPALGILLEIDGESLGEQHKQALMDPGFCGDEGAGTITLDSVQFLMNTLLNLHTPKEEQRSYVIDLGGHRARRQQELEATALAAAEQVRSTGQPTEIKGLSAAERRQVHTFLSQPQFEDLATESQGREPDRRLLIQPVGSPQSHPWQTEQ